MEAEVLVVRGSLFQLTIFRQRGTVGPFQRLHYKQRILQVWNNPKQGFLRSKFHNDGFTTTDPSRPRLLASRHRFPKDGFRDGMITGRDFPNQAVLRGGSYQDILQIKMLPRKNISDE